MVGSAFAFPPPLSAFSLPLENGGRRSDDGWENGRESEREMKGEEGRGRERERERAQTSSAGRLLR